MPKNKTCIVRRNCCGKVVMDLTRFAIQSEAVHTVIDPTLLSYYNDEETPLFLQLEPGEEKCRMCSPTSFLQKRDGRVWTNGTSKWYMRCILTSDC